MLTWHPEMEAIGRAVVAIGVFDGVHLGHQALIRTACSHAHADGIVSAVVTFDRDPDQVVRPDTAAPQLLPLDDKLALIAEQACDVVLVVPFDGHVASMPPEEFLDSVLLDVFEPESIVVGYDFRFGAKAAGDIGTLEATGRAKGFSVVAHALVTIGEEPVTSTRIRALIAAGDVEAAAGLLGRPHRLYGEVVHGRGEGRRVLGIPTANLVVDRYAALPAPGVYAGVVEVDGVLFPAGVSAGRPPTFPDAEEYLEAHLIGFDGDLYGRTLRVDLLQRLRAQERFESLEALAQQMRADLERARDLVLGE